MEAASVLTGPHRPKTPPEDPGHGSHERWTMRSRCRPLCARSRTPPERPVPVPLRPTRRRRLRLPHRVRPVRLQHPQDLGHSDRRRQWLALDGTSKIPAQPLKVALHLDHRPAEVFIGAAVWDLRHAATADVVGVVDHLLRSKHAPAKLLRGDERCREKKIPL